MADHAKNEAGKNTHTKQTSGKQSPVKAKQARADKKQPPAKPEKIEGLLYKKHPLRRLDRMIYYGSMAEPYIIIMQIKETKTEKNLEMATKVSVELQRTSPDPHSRDRIIKHAEKDNLFAAMDVATIWLERYLASSKKS